MMLHYSAGGSLVERSLLGGGGAQEVRDPLQDQALVLCLATFPLQQGSASGVLKHLPDALVGLGRALEVLVRTNLLADFLALCGRNCGQPSDQILVEVVGPGEGTGKHLTSSGVTGFWLVLRSSSMVLLS